MRQLIQPSATGQAQQGMWQIDIPRSGLDNMAIDQAMLEQTAADSIPRMRIYRWSEPTVSLGYFQKFADFQNFATTQGLPVVRRATGGGAIVHHYDWTYSIALAATEVDAKAHGASTRLYDCIHDAAVHWLEQWGVAAQMWSKQLGQDAACSTDGCSFLCFERRHAGDVVCSQSKLLGSAQRRLGRAILQHGSLLLQSSPYAPSLLGLVEQAAIDRGKVEADLSEFSLHLVKAIGTAFALKLDCREWVSQVMPTTNSAKRKLASIEWTARI